MKKILTLFTLILLAFACKENPLTPEYKSMAGIWHVTEAKHIPKGVFNILYTSCNPSKKNLKGSGHGCTGLINTKERNLDSSSISYFLDITRIIHINEVRNFNSLNNPTPQTQKLNDYLKGNWTYSITDSSMTWENDKNQRILFKKEK